MQFGIVIQLQIVVICLLPDKQHHKKRTINSSLKEIFVKEAWLKSNY